MCCLFCAVLGGLDLLTLVLRCWLFIGAFVLVCVNDFCLWFYEYCGLALFMLLCVDLIAFAGYVLWVFITCLVGLACTLFELGLLAFGFVEFVVVLFDLHVGLCCVFK